jgi:low affinity Fe/Cu permease
MQGATMAFKFKLRINMKNIHKKPPTQKKINTKKDTLQGQLDKALLERKNKSINCYFNVFAKKISEIVGNAWSFIFACSTVIIWIASGHYFKYSDTWQLVINTGTTIITFLIVFLIQNTQNRDTAILNLKIDELIRSKKGAKNPIINIAELSDIELKQLEEAY